LILFLDKIGHSTKEITSNGSSVPSHLPQFTSGEGDTAGGQSSGGENQHVHGEL
jgi:hypothetical protein